MKKRAIMQMYGFDNFSRSKVRQEWLKHTWFRRYTVLLRPLRRKPDNEVIQGVEIVDVTSEGMGVARSEGLVLFVRGAVPGDLVDAKVYRKKKNFAEAEVAAIVRPSEQRVVPKCIHFGTCGGCKWQNVDYAAQLAFKRKYVDDALRRIGHLDFTEVLPVIGSARIYHYRNKLEFTFSDKKWLTPAEMQTSEEIGDRNALGFHIPGLFDKVLDLKECFLQPEPANSIRNFVRAYAVEHGLSFFSIREQRGMLRTLMVRNAASGFMVLLTVFEFEPDVLFPLLNAVKTRFPEVSALLYAHNGKKNDSMDGLEIKVLAGADHLVEEMEGLKFRISARSFYQTNPGQAYSLYKVARELCGLTGRETVYDLYTGTGTIANFVAAQAKKVVGIEYVEDAVRDARTNSELNKIGNTVFFSGDMKDMLTEGFFSANGRPDVVITDPPRAGMHEHVARALNGCGAPTIVYVSCNPATQARDLAIMDAYRINCVQPVDMFPHTTHIENVVQLKLK